MTKSFRIATYNVEWMDNLFDEKGALLVDDDWSGRQNVTRAQQIGALGIVFSAIDADAVLIIEAPDVNPRRNGLAALETFAEWAGFRARRALVGFVNDTQQEVALLYDPDRLSARHDPRESAKVPRFDQSFDIDLDIDAKLDRVKWSKPPLEVSMTAKDGIAFRMIGVHAKSKAPHGARDAKSMMRLAIANRRKQLAQCIWLRARVDEHLNAGDPLIVLGDFNDGPGLDEYEKLFGRSGVEIVMGENGQVPLYDPHAAMVTQRRVGGRPSSARFWIGSEDRWLQVLLDYIMVSPELAERNGRWRIWHPFDDAVCYRTQELREALLQASDHFPVTLDIGL